MSKEAPNITPWIYSKAKDWRKIYKNEKGDTQNATALLKNNCAQVEDVSCAATTSGKVISTCRVPTKIMYQNTGKELDRYALLYSCQFRKISRIEIFGISGEIIVKTFDGNQINSSLALENLKVESNGRSNKQWIKLRASYTRASN